MGAPSIYVYDCSNAGIIVDSFKQFADQHEKEYEVKRSCNLKPKVSVFLSFSDGLEYTVQQDA
jgi:hypothetical protein